MKLKGKNLGERQHDFNFQVNEAINKKIAFASMRDNPVDTDIDQLFRIDIASRLKDVAFLMQMLISGDSLYVTRALKSVWLFDDEHQLIMNPEYLSKNIFPHMSSKMMKKLITTASLWIKNEERTEKFYLYCKKNGMANFAIKFLFFTSEAFKESLILNDFETVENFEGEKLQFLIGRSFKLADLYRSKSPQYKANRVLYQLRFLYSVNSDKYLDMLEKYFLSDTCLRFGLRISKDVLKRYKERILKHPRVYLTILNKSIIAKCSNSEDAKLYLNLMLTYINNVDEFWSKFMSGLEFLINIIPLGERYDFLKKLHDEKYSSAIEMNYRWYNFGYHKHMTEAQKEQWALDQLASKKETLGGGQDFLWYKFIKFELAFEEIKKLILITKNDDKRIKMLCVLVECAKNEVELEKLLTYFYTRHGNETERKKYEFLDHLSSRHNILSLGQNCWSPLNKILYSLDVYNVQNACVKIEYKMIASFYHILHSIDLPEVLKCFVKKLAYIPAYLKSRIEQYDQNGFETIYKYILKIQLEELIDLEKQEYNDEVKTEAREIIMCIDRLRSTFQKREDLPQVVINFKELDAETFCTKPLKSNKNEFKRVTPKDFMRNLKKDATLVSDFDLLESNIQFLLKFNIKELLHKLRTYFHDDTAQQYLEYFKKAYSKDDNKIIFTAVYGILVLADEKYKKEFILQHTPEDPKIQHDEIDRNLVYIREAICRFACYSRPPVEIDNILPYIKGDYLKYCLPMFNVYMTRYPPAIREKFVKSLLNTPVSIQKHGVRLAFQCFKKEELIDLILKSWKKYQNVSLRMVIYEYVMNFVKKYEATRKDMFEVLKKITLDLKEDECEEVIKIVRKSRDLPEELKGFYLDAVWTAISKFSDCKLNIEAKAEVLTLMVANFSGIRKDIVKKIVTDHVDDMLVKNKIIPDKERLNYVHYDDVAWTLTHMFICIYCRDEDTLELVKYIVQKCVERWNNEYFDFKLYEPVLVFQRFCSDFSKSLIENYYAKQNTIEFNRVLETILTCLTASIPKHNIFFLMLNLKVAMLTNKVIDYYSRNNDKTKLTNELNDKEAEDIAQEYRKELEVFVKEMVENKMFSLTILNVLGDVIANNVRRITASFYHKLLIFIASHLADSSMSEIVLLSVAITPDLCGDGDWKYYQILLNKISNIDSDEVKYLMNVKSAKNEYKVKRRKL